MSGHGYRAAEKQAIRELAGLDGGPSRPQHLVQPANYRLLELAEFHRIFTKRNFETGRWAPCCPYEFQHCLESLALEIAKEVKAIAERYQHLPEAHAAVIEIHNFLFSLVEPVSRKQLPVNQ